MAARLDPALRHLADTRTDLSPEVLPTVRDLGRDGDTAFALGYGAAREA